MLFADASESSLDNPSQEVSYIWHWNLGRDVTFGSTVSFMKITDADEDVKKEESSFTADWRVTWNSNFGHQWGGTQKVQERTMGGVRGGVDSGGEWVMVKHMEGKNRREEGGKV